MALHLYIIRIGSIEPISALLLVWIKMWLYVSIDFILKKLLFAWCYFSGVWPRIQFQVFELIPLLEIIPNDKDADLWALFVLTDDHCFCLFAFRFLFQLCLIIVTSLLYFLQLIQDHQCISSFYFVLSYFHSWASFYISHNDFTVEKEEVWKKHTSLSDTTLLFFCNELISPSAHIAAVFSKCIILSIYLQLCCLIIPRYILNQMPWCSQWSTDLPPFLLPELLQW